MNRLLCSRVCVELLDLGARLSLVWSRLCCTWAAARRGAQLRCGCVQMKRELEAKAQNEKAKEMQSYKGLMDKSAKMVSNKDIDLKGKSVREIEEDFM